MTDTAEIIQIICDARAKRVPGPSSPPCRHGDGGCEGARGVKLGCPNIDEIKAELAALTEAGMTIDRDWFADAADKTLDAAHPHVPPCRAANGRGEAHAIWLLNQVFTKQVVGRKANSWLCYAQGVLVEQEMIDLDDARRCNHEASQAMIGAGK